MGFVVPRIMLVVLGAILLGLAFCLPIYMEQLRDHGGAYFTPGFESLKEALTSIITAFSIILSMAIAIVILPLERAERIQKKRSSIYLGVATLFILSTGIVWTLAKSMIRPLTGTAPTSEDVYWSLRLLISGLGFTMFTLASLLS